jgi:hypothetical protein
MATTTNYSWETPDDTDLVKDGAAAIRTLGSSIDTTTKALNPSTTLGDIEYRSSTANTNTRLGVGSTGQVLTVAGGVPSWATPASTSPTFDGVSVTNTVAQSIANNTNTALTFNSEDFDTSGYHSTSTNTSRLTVPAGKAGYFLVTANLVFALNATGGRDLYFAKNGSAVRYAAGIAGNGTYYVGQNLSMIFNLAVNDYIELFCKQTSGGSLNADTTPGGGTFIFQMQYLGA